MYVQSTPVMRTLQSSYAQLMGMYSPAAAAAGKQRKEEGIKEAKPMLKVRRGAAKIRKADPYSMGYVPIPVVSYLGENTPVDDLDYGGCHYTHNKIFYIFLIKGFTYDEHHWNDNATFSEAADYIFPVIRDPVGIAFNKTLD